MKECIRYVLLTVAASPILLLRGAARLRHHWHFLRIASTAAIRCTCGRPIFLVGIWRCSCNYTYRGHLLRHCPICNRIPRMVRCYGCGLTAKLPEAPYGDADAEG
jgi:hypothetical protein